MNLVKDDRLLGIEPVAHDVVDEDRKRVPKGSPIVGTDGGKLGRSATGIDERCVAVLRRKLPSQVTDISRVHGPLHTRGCTLEELP